MIVKKYDFFRNKYGCELLIDLIPLESLKKYIITSEPHMLSYFDITLILNGNGFFCLDGKEYGIEKNSLFFSSPGQIRTWKINEVPIGKVLIFEEEFLCSFFNDAMFVRDLIYFNNDNALLSLTQEETENLKLLLLGIEKEIHSFKQYDKHILRALLYQVLIYINREYAARYPSGKKNENNYYIREFEILVNQNFFNEHSVNFYANKLNITPGHLNDLSKEINGVSAKQHIQNRILTEAKRLLCYSGLSVSEISWRLNYEDPTYFSRIFKKNTGSTPLEFRQNHNP